MREKERRSGKKREIIIGKKEEGRMREGSGDSKKTR